MTGLLSLLAIVLLAALAVWVLAGLIMRFGGALLAARGLLLTAMTDSPSAALLAVVSALAWLGGHWLFAVRHHYFASPFARRVFNQALPHTLNTTRR
jgi:hypothetical protein